MTAPLPPGARVVAYARDSGGEQQDRSIAQQIEAYQQHCASNGWRLLHIFQDVRSGAVSSTARQGLDACLNYLRTTPRPADGVLVWKQDRLARDQIESAYVRADLRRRGYVIISLADNIPDVGDLTFIFEDLLAWKAQRDRHDLSVNIKRGLHYVVHMKKVDGTFEGFAPGVPPTCYKRERVTLSTDRGGTARTVSRWVPDPAKWEAGKTAWAMRAGGATLRAVHEATSLFANFKGYSTFFSNPIYKGEFVFGGETLTNFVPPLCTPEQWAAAQAISAAAKARAPLQHPRRVASHYLFSGQIFCATDNRRMIGRTGRNRAYVCPICKLRLPAITLERHILGLLESKLTTPDSLGALFAAQTERTKAASGTHEAEATALSSQIVNLNRAIANLLDQIEENPSAHLRQRLAAREVELANAEARMATLTHIPPPPPAHDQLATIANALKKVFSAPDPDQLKPLLRAIVIRLDATRESGRLQYRLPLFRPTGEPIDSDPLGALSIHTLTTQW